MAFRRRLLLLILTLSLFATACFEIGEVAVQNETRQDLILWTSQVECDFRGSSIDQTILAPGDRETIYIVETDLAELPTCIAVAAPGSRIFTREVERGTFYVVSEQGTTLRVLEAGPHEEEFSLDLSLPPVVLWAFGLPLLAGAIAAMIITIKFFVDWGRRPQTGWS